MPPVSSTASLFIGPRIHVLEVLGNAIVGGMETWVERMVERLPAERFRVSVVCPFESALSERLRAIGLGVHTVPMPEELCWTSVNQLRVLVEFLQIDLLHAHLPNAHLLAGVAGRLAGRPVLTTVHGRQLTLTDLEVHRAVGSHLSVVCRHTHLHALGLGVAPSHLSCDPNGVDTQIFAPRRARGSLRRSLKLPPSAPLVGFVGRLSHEKGPEVLVRAAQLLRQSQPDAHVVLVGEGPCRDALDGLIESLGLDGCVHLLGLREDMPSVYAEFDVLASTSYSEAMPLAIMEAMACGLPVVATRVGGVPDMVQHGGTGWLVAPGDFEDTARRLAALLGDGDGRRAMGLAARRHALRHWQLDGCVARLGSLMERLAGMHMPMHDLQDMPRRRDDARLDSAAEASGHLAPQPGTTLNQGLSTLFPKREKWGGSSPGGHAVCLRWSPSFSGGTMKTLFLALAVALGSLVSTGCAVTDGQSTVGEFVDDATITTRVKARFAQDQQVSAMRINVETLSGTVQLSGFATSQAEKDKAATIARAVPGVRTVQNNIVVRPAS